MPRRLTNFRLDTSLEAEFEAKIKEINSKLGRGAILLHGDKSRYLHDAIREWIARN